MKDYKITMSNDAPLYAGEDTRTWHGFDEQQAVAQAMLYYAQAGARKCEVVDFNLL